MFSKICNPTISSARARKLLFQVNFTNWGSESAFRQLLTLVSLDFLHFVMVIIIGIAGEVTRNPLSDLDSSSDFVVLLPPDKLYAIQSDPHSVVGPEYLG